MPAVKDPGTSDARTSANACRATADVSRAAGATRAALRSIAMLTILFDGIAYGMLLFLLAVGLAVTLGLMNFVNLAHGAFAMAGGYLTVLLMQPAGRAVPRVPAARLRRSPRRSARCSSARCTGRCTRKPHLDQVLFSIGLVFMAVAAVDYFVGSHAAVHPAARRGCGAASRSARRRHRHYRLFIIVVCGVLTLVLQWCCRDTRFGSRLRAAVDDPRVAAGSASTSTVVFLLTFAVGSGLAGLGGALGAEMLGLDPTFPLKFMIYFLIVVRGRRHDDDHRAAAGRRCCWASPTWRASTTCPSSAPSSSTR